MNPLSPVTYFQRHKRFALLLVGLITLATTGVYIMVSVLDSIPMRAQYSYLTRVSRVYPAAGDALEPGVVSQIQINPDVARVVWDNGMGISPPTLIGVDSARLMGVSQENIPYLMSLYGVRLKEGRMLVPRTNEILLSEELARALELQIGDQIEQAVNERYYWGIPAPLTLVGILEGDPNVIQGPSTRVGFASYEYLESHEFFAPRFPNLLVVAREGSREKVDEFLEREIASALTETETYKEVSQLVAMGRRGLYLIFGIVNCLVAVVVALVVGVINRITLMQRLPELGLLHAVGNHKNRLVGRLTLETVAVAGVGWGAGLGLSLLILAGLDASVYYSRGMELDLANPAPFWFTFPIPVVVVAFATASAKRVFSKFDAIAIIERGKLSMEEEDSSRTGRRSSIKPLSPWTFYGRHRRRGILLVVSMALMILGVAFPVFLTSMPLDTMRANANYLQYMSEVYPSFRSAVDPGVAAQIKSHPAVEQVIQFKSLGLEVFVPPGGQTQATIFGVSEADLPKLMDLLDVHLVEGRLPGARSNEIVISKAIALNRGLEVGDTVGRPVQERDENTDLMIQDDIPTEMVVVGLLSRDDLWVGFASLEYLESHELTISRRTHLLIRPNEGNRETLNSWLEASIASPQTKVSTFESLLRDHKQITQSILLLISGVEGTIAIVAAIALAILNYIFFSQRQEEFGILHAIGRTRSWLVLRTMKETGSVVGIAWLMGGLVCMAGVVILQATIYEPRGLHLDLTNLIPWFFTLPIPLAVIIVGAGAIARMFSRLDPVSIVERRS